MYGPGQTKLHQKCLHVHVCVWFSPLPRNPLLPVCGSTEHLKLTPRELGVCADSAAACWQHEAVPPELQAQQCGGDSTEVTAV